MGNKGVVKVKGKGSKVVKAFKWKKKGSYGEDTVTKVKLQGENFCRKRDLQCSRSVFLLKDKGLVLKFEDGDWQTYTEKSNYKDFSKKHRKRVPKHFGCYDLTKKSEEFDIWVSVHQYIDIDRTKVMTKKQENALQVWCDETEVYEVGPDDRCNCTTDDEANSGIDKNGKWWVLDYGL